MLELLIFKTEASLSCSTKKRTMEKLKFGDKVKINDGREAVVQEDQEKNSDEVKLMIEGDDFAHVVKADQLEKIGKD